MTTPTPDQQRAWMAQWRTAGPALARIRAEEVQQVDLAAVIVSLNDAYRAARAMAMPTSPSGLIEQQRLFHCRRPA